MLYFTPEGQIPAGEGFTLLGWQHLLILAILGTFTVLSLRWMRRLHTGELNRLLRMNRLTTIHTPHRSNRTMMILSLSFPGKISTKTWNSEM